MWQPEVGQTGPVRVEGPGGAYFRRNVGTGVPIFP